MKNLKKVLALGLALIMLMGMFTVVSAAETKKVASDLTDWESVQHQDAVSLMVDLGIINGLPDGSFNPTGNIDRASWAKMVYYAATGSDNADAYLGTASGLKDIAGNWAESYISYLKAGKYISGDNYGNYNPSANVTVAEACKMMLTTLGYDADDRGYQNDVAWAGNIMTDAKRQGLLENVDSNMTALMPLTRENAAEIVLNTLNANTVTSESRRDQGEKYIVSYSYGPTLGYDVFRMIKVVATVDKVNGDGNIEVGSIISPAIAEVEWTAVASAINSANCVKGTANLVGEDVNVYVKADGFKFSKDTGDISTFGAFKNVISSVAAKAGSTPVRVFTDGVVIANLIVRTSADRVASAFADDCAYFLNGALDETENKPTTIGAATRRGAVTEVYLNDAGEICTIKVYYYTVKQVEGEVVSKKNADGTTRITVPGVASNIESDKITGWQGLEEGDVVMTYETTLSAGVKSVTIEKCDTITGKVSTFAKNGSLTINGKTYRGTQLDVDFVPDTECDDDRLTDNTGWDNMVDEFKFWLDKNGSLVAAEQITETLDASKVCLVIETDVQTGSLGSSGSLAANLLFVDGSTEIVKVAKVNGKATGVDTEGELKVVVDEVKDPAKQISATDAQKVLTNGKTGNKDKAPLTKYFNWKATTNGYELTELDASVNKGKSWKNVVSGVDTENGYKITKESDFTKESRSALDIKADGTTTFIMAKENTSDDTITYTVVKGFKNIHEMTATKVTAIAAADPSDPTAPRKIAKYVYLETTKFSDDAPEGYVFFVDNNWKADPELYADDGVVLANIVDTDGTQTTMRVSSAIAANLNAATEDNKLSNTSNVYTRNFWGVKAVDENGVVSDIGDDDGHAANLQTLEEMGNDVVVVGGKSWTYDSSTKFIYVDLGWADNTDNKANKIGVREDDDKFVVSESGKIGNPNTFFKASSVDPEDESKTYVSVDAVVIARVGTTTDVAEYVYVLRYLW